MTTVYWSQFLDRVSQALAWLAPVGASVADTPACAACASAGCRGAFQGLTASAAEPQDRLEPESWRSCSRSSRRTRKRRRSSSSSGSNANGVAV